MSRARAVIDQDAVFRSLPTAYLLMDLDLVIVDANQAYLTTVGRPLEELVGCPVFEAFPGEAEQMDELRASFQRARDTARSDPMPLFHYAIPDGEGFTDRYWSLISVPVLDRDGQVVLVAQRVEDVTDFVRERRAGEEVRERGRDYQRRFERAEADLFARVEELRTAREAEELAGRRLAGLAEVALHLADAESVEELVGVILERGLPVLGAGGAAVAVRTAGSDVLDVTMTGLGGASRVYRALPLDGPLPASVAARGGVVLVPDEVAAARIEGLAEAHALAGVVAGAALPLQIGRRLLGSLYAGWPTARTFPPDELELLRAFAAQSAQALDRVRVRQAERQAALRSQRLSETLQRSLLTPPPQSDDVVIAVRYQPAATLALVGGDWYDAFVTPSGGTSLVIGDVSGHDRDAAAVMGQLRNVLRGVSQTLGEPPAAVLSGLDGAVHRLDLDLLATMLLGELERRSPRLPGRAPRWRFTWSNAGHPPLLVVRANGAAELLSGETDLLIGLDPETERHDASVDLRSGDTVVLYTDGLVERRGESLDVGLERLRAAAAGVVDRDAEAWCDALLGAFGHDPDDDIALLVVQVRAPGGST